MRAWAVGDDNGVRWVTQPLIYDGLLIESFEYIAPVYQESFTVKMPKPPKLVEDRSGREDKTKKQGLFSSIFARGDKKEKAHKIHVSSSLTP